ncbi:MAG: hypothetical protein CVV44_11830 [Spirochaetae bacterium HGW-Spirochaetae-1]|nr:MAG: hypothetical protein CVV44_11830 [Spirochaetae bacterium HGW-Spirochaetae-1]
MRKKFPDKKGCGDMKNKISSGIIIALMLLFTIGCSRELAVKSAALGSNLSPDGTISDNSLVFTFKKPDPGAATRDLFNFIYFEGDTVCFSFKLTRKVNEKDVDIQFIEPSTGSGFKAERIDFIDDNVSGFSLLGSLLEQFYRDRLTQPLPEKAFCCDTIPFSVRLVLHGEKGDVIHEKKGSFEIRYRD